MGQSISTLRRRHSTRTLRDLAAPRDQTISPPTLTRKNLTDALQNVADYLASKKQNITLIIVGGAINTLLLQSRTHTHDVYFFNDSLTAAEVKCLSKVAKSALKNNQELGSEWLNNRTVLFIPAHIRRVLMAEAIGQHTIVFQALGLTALAAPWEYLFCAKTDRLSGHGNSTVQPYD
ncbi:hypothetical protein POX_h09516 [Penicillium oxalicum]|uniref:hypothetical protein n=1 Tax=Penicillium oxalicum TaxID=69781 RepID=UPI0020B8EE27|nr:hypothetical protein POX_h09516 [Penicillium oxalicum]KAI2785757.1 hypothetical protein POX_h09516 [Penicillium oxalicum]